MMLKLSRKPGESVEIGPNIRVTVIRVEGEKVYLGFDAPRVINIWRSELKEESTLDADGNVHVD